MGAGGGLFKLTVSVRFIELMSAAFAMFRFVVERSTELRLLRGVGRRESFRAPVGLEGVVERDTDGLADDDGFWFVDKCVTVLDLVIVALLFISLTRRVAFELLVTTTVSERGDFFTK